MIHNISDINLWEQGSTSSEQQNKTWEQIKSNGDTRIRTKNLFPCSSSLKVKISSNYNIDLLWFNEEGLMISEIETNWMQGNNNEFISISVPNDAKQVGILVKFTDNSNISPSEILNTNIYYDDGLLPNNSVIAENIINIIIGKTPAQKMYFGNDLIWQLPYDTEIQYLEGNGDQKITLNFDDITNNMIANNKLEYITNIQLTSTGDGAEGINNLYYFIGVSGNKYYSGCGSNYQKSEGVPDLNSHELKLVIENNTVTYYLDNNIIDTYSFNQGFSSNLNKFGLFYCIDYGSSLNKQRKSYAKLTLGNQIIFECIPVRVEQVGYMYDKVSKQLLSNQGTGSFTLGPDKT